MDAAQVYTQLTGERALEDEELVVQNRLAVVVLHEDPKGLHAAVQLVVPLEVRRDGEVHLKHGARDGLHRRRQLQPWELMHEAVDGLAHLGETNQLANLLAGEVVVALPR